MCFQSNPRGLSFRTSSLCVPVRCSLQVKLKPTGITWNTTCFHQWEVTSRDCVHQKEVCWWWYQWYPIFGQQTPHLSVLKPTFEATNQLGPGSSCLWVSLDIDGIHTGHSGVRHAWRTMARPCGNKVGMDWFTQFLWEVDVDANYTQKEILVPKSCSE